jgi:1,4-alpha-glucan branching enzyme
MRDSRGISAVQYRVSLLSDDDLYLFNEGSHYRLYEKLGAHPITVEGVAGRGAGVRDRGL